MRRLGDPAAGLPQPHNELIKANRLQLIIGLNYEKFISIFASSVTLCLNESSQLH